MNEVLPRAALNAQAQTAGALILFAGRWGQPVSVISFFSRGLTESLQPLWFLEFCSHKPQGIRANYLTVFFSRWILPRPMVAWPACRPSASDATRVIRGPAQDVSLPGGYAVRVRRIGGFVAVDWVGLLGEGPTSSPRTISTPRGASIPTCTVRPRTRRIRIVMSAPMRIVSSFFLVSTNMAYSFCLGCASPDGGP